MTNEQSESLAAQIAEQIAKVAPGAEVRVNPTLPSIPPNIAGNILEFLRRAQSTGMEAIAWVEAYQYVQQFVQPQPGVPFTGLPPQPPKK
jgi:hypothetical protein